MRIPARATARAICTSPNHNRTIATVKMTAPTVSRAIRTSGAAPAVGLGAGKFVGIVRCPTPHLSQFPNESVPIRTVSLAGFGNRVPSGLLPFLRFECLTSAARCGRTSYSAYGQARALRRLFAVRRVLSNLIVKCGLSLGTKRRKDVTQICLLRHRPHGCGLSARSAGSWACLESLKGSMAVRWSAISARATSRLTAMNFPYVAALGIGMIAAAVVGYLVGLIALRRTGIYFAMITVAKGQCFSEARLFRKTCARRATGTWSEIKTGRSLLLNGTAFARLSR
jgi:hypothetical protein